MQRYTIYLYLESALHVSGGTSTHHHYDGWKYHPKRVEQFPDINNLCNVASCWIYIGILLGAHPIFHVSRIRVKGRAHECPAVTLHRFRCVVRLRHPFLDFCVTTQKSCDNRQEELFLRGSCVCVYRELQGGIWWKINRLCTQLSRDIRPKLTLLLRYSSTGILREPD
jgi:hypothetical protein